MGDPASPFTCPNTVTIRRNPHRRARPTPSATNISSFPLKDILSINIPTTETATFPILNHDSASLKVFFRVRPLSVAPKKPLLKPNSKPKIKSVLSVKSCVVVNGLTSVTVTPPASDSTRLKSEVYTGFSRVFAADSSQDEVYDRMMRPIVEEFLNGRSGLLAALGPSGSGKTHTVFGSAKDPGLVPRALRHIFQAQTGNNSMSSRSFYLSVFEISIEKGKGEKLFDLSPDGGDIHMQQSVVKGLKEVLIKDVAQAEAILSAAKLKRATAMTNSNSQSSRSQCIINIRCTIDEAEGESPLGGTGLTFVDLAGAERERKTGNQGGRLIESNFINNTSMVFSSCLRSLLEHQKNPKKPLEKHFQNSLLTRYLRDYLEGRKRMALILTARSGPEDYFDVSFLLRQASPYMEIKFHNVEETSKLPGNKRRNQTICSDKHKKVKRSNADEKDEVGRTTKDPNSLSKEDVSNEGKGKSGDMLAGNKSTVAEESNPNAKLQREYNVLQGFTKALWNVLKEYKERVKGMQNEIVLLTQNFSAGQDRYVAMKKELDELKSRCACRKQRHIDDVCCIGGINSASKLSVMELANFEQASAESQGLVALECVEKSAVYSSSEQSPFYSDQKPLQVLAPEAQHKVSPFKLASFSQEKDNHDNFVGISSASKAQASAELQGLVALECGENSAVYSSSEQSPFSSDQKPLQVLAPEEQHKVSPFECKLASFSQEKDNHDNFVGISSASKAQDSPSTIQTLAFVDKEPQHVAILRTPFPEAALPSCDFENSVQLNDQAHCSPMKCEISHDSMCIDYHEKDEKPEHFSILETPFQEAALPSCDFDNSVQSNDQAHCSPMKCEDDCHEKDEKPDHVAILGTPFQEAAPPSHDFENSVQQNDQAHSPMKCEMLHDSVSIDDCHEKELVEKVEKIATDAAAHFPESHVMDLKIPRENNGDGTDEISDKENVLNSPQTNFNSKLEANGTSQFKPSETVRPKRRLMPASSLLLRDAGSLDVTDDSVKRRGGKGGQRLAEEERKRTRGSASLLKLLRTHLPR